MSKGPLNPQLKTSIANKLQVHGIELDDIEYRKEANGQILRVIIDTAKGVDSDTCVIATKAIKDFIDTSSNLDYDFLEVSSPGIDRVLDKNNDLSRFLGLRVLVKTSELLEGSKKFIGILADSQQDGMSIEIDGNLLQINRDIITMIRLYSDI